MAEGGYNESLASLEDFNKVFAIPLKYSDSSKSWPSIPVLLYKYASNTTGKHFDIPENTWIRVDSRLGQHAESIMVTDLINTQDFLESQVEYYTGSRYQGIHSIEVILSYSPCSTCSNKLCGLKGILDEKITQHMMTIFSIGTDVEETEKTEFKITFSNFNKNNVDEQGYENNEGLKNLRKNDVNLYIKSDDDWQDFLKAAGLVTERRKRETDDKIALQYFEGSADLDPINLNYFKGVKSLSSVSLVELNETFSIPFKYGDSRKTWPSKPILLYKYTSNATVKDIYIPEKTWMRVDSGLGQHAVSIIVTDLINVQDYLESQVEYFTGSRYQGIHSIEVILSYSPCSTCSNKLCDLKRILDEKITQNMMSIFNMRTETEETEKIDFIITFSNFNEIDEDDHGYENKEGLKNLRKNDIKLDIKLDCNWYDFLKASGLVTKR
ncbi:uncharacterized protein LOC134722274 [Mytilus trossulus]|uniref:uncharacterized protein LOC134722274 n=1 Tax=Mytilus trossulus TaxID=6551 RepID=UPI003006D7D2